MATAERAAPESLDSIRARAALSMIEALTVAEVPPPPPAFGAGRLELVGVSGLFGVWNAVAGGVSVASLAQLDGGPAFLGTAAGALVAGVGFGVGGYYLGEALELDESKSKLVASGLIWGSNMGMALAPLVASAAIDTGTALPLIVLTPIVLAGYAGGAGGLAAGMFIDLTPADVSMVNSGGFFGSVVGGLMLTNLLAWQVSGTAPYSLTYVAFNAAGLAAGGLLAKNSDYTWGETLVADLGMAIGGTTLGLGSAGVLLFSSSGDPRVAAGLVTGATALGMAGGYAAGLATARLLRPADAAVQIAPMSGAVLDVDGNVVATAGFAAHF